MNAIEAAEVTRVAYLLGDAATARPARDFPGGQADVDSAGLYSWWVDEAGRRTFAQVFDAELPELIYVGQAGATSNKSGVERAATLRSRINGNHLHGNIGSSTFRQTLTAVLLQPIQLELDRPGRLTAASNAQVSAWMVKHLRIATVACPDRSTLSGLEHAVLEELDPPLNLMGMASTPVRSRLKALRKMLR